MNSVLVELLLLELAIVRLDELSRGGGGVRDVVDEVAEEWGLLVAWLTRRAALNLLLSLSLRLCLHSGEFCWLQFVHLIALLLGGVCVIL